MRLLGLSLVPMWVPGMTFRVHIEPGAVHATCIKVGDAPVAAREIDSWESIFANVENAVRAALEDAGSVLFDIARFRQLMLEKFRLGLAHTRRAKEDGRPGWTLRPYLRVAVPTTQLADIFSQHIQDFVSGQVSKMGVVAAAADLFAALGHDAAMLGASETSAAGSGGGSVPAAAEGR